MLREIVCAVRAKNVLLSGSYVNETNNSDQIGEFAKTLAFWLIMNNYKLFSSYGKTLGQFVVSGAFEGCEKISAAVDFADNTGNKFAAWGDLPISDKRVVNNFNNRVYLFPFPYNIPMPDEDRAVFYARLRDNMVANTQISIFICGEKYKNEKDISEGIILADGITKEYNAAKDNGCLCIPVAWFGGVAESRHNMTALEPRSDGVSNTVTTVTKDNYLAERLAALPELKREGITDSDAETSKTVRVGGHGMHKGHTWDVIADDVRIRKLTPRECLRLMGWKDGQINKIRAAGISNAQTYKQAGNGIVVTVLMAIFGELFNAPYRERIEAWDYRKDTDSGGLLQKSEVMKK